LTRLVCARQRYHRGSRQDEQDKVDTMNALVKLNGKMYRVYARLTPEAWRGYKRGKTMERAGILEQLWATDAKDSAKVYVINIMDSGRTSIVRW
jgi:hypothetical protein